MKFKYKNLVDAIQFTGTNENIEEIKEFIGDKNTLRVIKNPIMLELDSYFFNSKNEKILLKTDFLLKTDWIVKINSYQYNKFTNKDFISTFEKI